MFKLPHKLHNKGVNVMDNNEVIRIGDLKATGNIWKINLMRLIIGIIVRIIILFSLIGLKIENAIVIYFMSYGLYNFFEMGIIISCLNYVRDETNGVNLSDIAYPLNSRPVRCIIIALLSVIVLPVFYLLYLFLLSIGLGFLEPLLNVLAIITLAVYRYVFFIIPYLVIDYPEESLTDIIKTGLFFERKLDFLRIVFIKLPIPIIYTFIMTLNGLTPNGFLPESLYYFIWIVGGTISFVVLLINIPRVDMAFAVLYNDVIYTYYEDDNYEDEVVNPYFKEYEESYHEYGDFNSDDFLD